MVIAVWFLRRGRCEAGFSLDSSITIAGGARCNSWLPLFSARCSCRALCLPDSFGFWCWQACPPNAHGVPTDLGSIRGFKVEACIWKMQCWFNSCPMSLITELVAANLNFGFSAGRSGTIARLCRMACWIYKQAPLHHPLKRKAPSSNSQTSLTVSFLLRGLRWALLSQPSCCFQNW